MSTDVADGPDAPGAPDAAAGPSRSVWLYGRARLILRHEWTLAALGAIVLSLWLNRGSLADPAHTLPSDIWDPSLVAYLIAWGGHALVQDPTNVWQLNTFYPSPYGLAYTDSLLAYAPFAIIGTGPEAALVRYNILFILAEALVMFGVYALVRQLGGFRLAAAVAGIACAVAPWRLSQTGHLQILSTGGMALALAMLARGHGVRWRRGGDASGQDVEPPERKLGWIYAGWLVATWQLAIGFGIGLTFLYVLLGCMLAGAGIWFYRHRALPPWRLLLADGVGGLIFAVTAVLLASPYLKVLELYPYAKRDAAWIALYSPPLTGIFIAPEQSTIWGQAHETARAQLTIPGEMALLPGYVLFALALAGLVFSVWPLLVRVLLAAGVVIAVIFSLGTNGPADGRLGYLLLLNLPGFEGLRTPGRIIMWVTLLLALLAAGAVSAWVELAVDSARRRGLTRPPVYAMVALLLPLALVLGEGAGEVKNARVPDSPAALSTVAAPLLVLPTHEVGDMPVMLWSTNGFPAMVNGGSGLVPSEQNQVREAVKQFPDAASVSYLRAVGVRSVVVVRSWAQGSPWQDPDALRIDGLGITRTSYSDMVVFSLN